jgi:uncharacterized protein YecE (DUF72 family)
MKNIIVGTASWTDKALIESGLFYPPEVKTAEQRLRYYAKQFPVVEVDSAYYGMPSARNAALWAERTPETFMFNIKAFRLFTQHQTPPDALPKDIREALEPIEKKNVYYGDLPQELNDELWRRFWASIKPLQQADKLGVVLLQFPPWFVYRRRNLEHILTCAHKLSDCRIAVEFRNKSWFTQERREEVLAFEREHKLTHVVVDEPQGFSNSIPALWETTTADLAIVRLHGRNRETWQKKGLASSAERFKYLYSGEELQTLGAAIRGLKARVTQLHVVFNNNYDDYAQRNAAELKNLIG